MVDKKEARMGHLTWHFATPPPERVNTPPGAPEARRCSWSRFDDNHEHQRTSGGEELKKTARHIAIIFQTLYLFVRLNQNPDDAASWWRFWHIEHTSQGIFRRAIALLMSCAHPTVLAAWQGRRKLWHTSMSYPHMLVCLEVIGHRLNTNKAPASARAVWLKIAANAMATYGLSHLREDEVCHLLMSTGPAQTGVIRLNKARILAAHHLSKLPH